MLDEGFPQEHGKRRAVIVLNESMLDVCRYDLPPKDRKFLYDSESYVLGFPLKTINDDNLALRNIVDADLLRPGTILMQSPYDRNVYVDLEQAAEAFAVEKMRHFSRLCQYLGASDVVVEQVDVTRQKESNAYSTKASTPMVSVSAKMDNTEENQIRRTFSISAQYTGGSPNIEGAERYLRSKQLWGDVVMRSLVEQCADQDNRLVEQCITICLSSESKKTFSVLGNLKLPEKNIGLSADYLKKIDSSAEYSLTFRVKFEQ